MKLNRLTIILILFAAIRTTGQNNFAGVGIGQRAPDVNIQNIINYKTSSAKISDFKNKLLILDFWATWCSPCVASFPKLDKLQKKFGDRIQILPVSGENEATVKDFLIKMQKVTNLLPASVVQDTVLSKIYKYKSIPHYVWINKDGIIQAVTGKEEVTEDNIEKILNDNKFSLKEKKDFRKPVDENKPIFLVGNLVDNQNSEIELLENPDRACRSLLIPYTFGYNSFAFNKPGRITAMNQSIKNLYRWAYSEFKLPLFSINRIMVEIDDSLVRKRITGDYLNDLRSVDSFQAWAVKNAYCYELVVPASFSYESKFEIMRVELNNYFGNLLGITGQIEKRKVRSLVLVRTINEDKIATSGAPNAEQHNAFYLKIVNCPVELLVRQFSTYFFQHLKMPIIDGTGYNGNIDIELNCRLSSLEDVNKELGKYGLKFTEEERLIDMIVISNKVAGANTHKIMESSQK